MLKTVVSLLEIDSSVLAVSLRNFCDSIMKTNNLNMIWWWNSLTK